MKSAHATKDTHQQISGMSRDAQQGAEQENKPPSDEQFVLVQRRKDGETVSVMDVYVGKDENHFSVPTSLGEAVQMVAPRFLKWKTTSSCDSSWDEVHDGSLSMEEDDPDFEEFDEQPGGEIIAHVSTREPVYLHECTAEDFEAVMAWAKKKVAEAHERVQVLSLVKRSFKRLSGQKT